MKENKLIAEFMGLEIIDRPYGNGFVTLSETEICDVDDLSYHTDWNCLMPVVEKCYNTQESYNLHKDIEDAFIDKFDDRLKAVYLSVVSFIKSYNEAMGQESVYSIRDNN